MRTICKITGWNTVLPDRVPVKQTISVDGKISREIVKEEPVPTETIIKYNGKREVWRQIRDTLCLSPEILAKIEYGIQQGDEIKPEKRKK